MPQRQPTILQIIPRLDTGGAELSTVEITEAVVRAGGRMLVATEGGRMAERITAAGGEILSVAAGSKNPLRIIANGAALAKLIRAQGIDLIHARSRAPAWSALIAARRTGIPFVTTYHGAYGESGRAKRLYNSVMARADVVIANSQYTAGLIRSRYGTPEARVRVIYRGVDVDGFNPDALDPARIAALRRQWGLAADVPVILKAARLTSWKGHGFIIDALGRLKREGALGDAVLILAGDAQGREGYVETLKAQIIANGLDGRVHLVGHCADMPAAFALANVAVVGSDGVTAEAFGRAAAEAQAAGCPVIAADFGAPPETVKAVPRVSAAERTGWLVPPADTAALAAALREALTLAPADRLAMGRRARRHICERFTADAMQRQTLAVYDGLLNTSLTASFQEVPVALADE